MNTPVMASTIRNSLKPILLLLVPAFTLLAAAGTTLGSSPLVICLQKKVEVAPDNMTIGELRTICEGELKATDPAEEEVTQEAVVVEERIEMDMDNILKPFTIMSHKQNYILFAANNFNGYSSDEFEEYLEVNDIELDDLEAKFQISIKTPLRVNLFDSGVSLWAAYTVRSFWQVYNDDISSPFRETNHEPEAWAEYQPDWEFFGFKTTFTSLGIVHQSNGQASNLSRSWNRIYASVIFGKGNFIFLVKPWYRLPEDRENNDNPDITDYLGHGEIRMAYKYKEHVFSLMSRNNLESGFSKGALELGWSFPLGSYPYLKGYIQYFSGYGESLIDYNEYVNSIGVGVLLTDLL